MLDGSKAGQLDGMRRIAYDGGELPLTERDIATAQVTTRDIDRGDSPHYLLKEISEAPASFRKTHPRQDRRSRRAARASVGARALPPDIRARLADGSITKIKVIGQGTAAVAGPQHGGDARHPLRRRNSTSIRSPQPSSAASACVST